MQYGIVINYDEISLYENKNALIKLLVCIHKIN